MNHCVTEELLREGEPVRPNGICGGDWDHATSQIDSIVIVDYNGEQENPG